MRWRGLVLFCAGAILLILANVGLVFRNRALQDRIRGLSELPAGVAAPPLDGLHLSGAPFRPDFSAGPTLILAFSQHCGACELNWAPWRRLLSSVDPRVQVVFVDIDSSSVPSRYLTKHQIRSGDVMVSVSATSILNYKFRTSPQTLLVTTQSRIYGTWSGLLSESQLTEIRSSIPRVLSSAARPPPADSNVLRFEQTPNNARPEQKTR